MNRFKTLTPLLSEIYRGLASGASIERNYKINKRVQPFTLADGQRESGNASCGGSHRAHPGQRCRAEVDKCWDVYVTGRQVWPGSRNFCKGGGGTGPAPITEANTTTAQASTGGCSNEYGDIHDDVYEDSMVELEIAIQSAVGPFEISNESIYYTDDLKVYVLISWKISLFCCFRSRCHPVTAKCQPFPSSAVL